MKSVTIVYRKSRKELNPQTKNPLFIRRSVDQYYTKLIEREKLKESIQNNNQQVIQRIKNKTAKNQRANDKFKLLESINIMTISKRQPFPENYQFQEEQAQHREKQQKRRIQSSKLIFKGIYQHQRKSHFSVQCQSEQKQGHLTSEKNVHAKLKNMLKFKPNQEAKNTVVVLSVQFILNELSFWEEEEIDLEAVKFWKHLQSYSHMVWICKSENSCKKLLKFSSTNNLRLDSVYQVQPRKNKKCLTVSYHNIEMEFGIRFHSIESPLKPKEQKKLIVVNGLRVETSTSLSADHFYNSLPVVKSREALVHFVKIDMNDRQRFGHVLKVLSSQQLPPPFNLSKVFQEINRGALPHEKLINHQHFDIAISHIEPEQDILLRIEEQKKELANLMTHQFSLHVTDRIKYDNQQCSLQFLIGDMLKRNLPFFHHSQNYKQLYLQYQQMQPKVHEPSTLFRNKDMSEKLFRRTDLKKRNQQIKQKQYSAYSQPIYVWNFDSNRSGSELKNA